jgi:hypothetical protein
MTTKPNTKMNTKQNTKIVQIFIKLKEDMNNPLTSPHIECRSSDPTRLLVVEKTKGEKNSTFTVRILNYCFY